MFDIKLDKIPWDKVLWIGGGAVAIYFAYQWYNASQATATANASAADQTDAQLAQLLLQAPLSSGEQADSGAEVTAPSVDTGNTELQTLVQSIINPTANASAAATSSATPVTTAPATSTIATISPAIFTVVTPAPILNQNPASTPSSLAASLAAIQPATNTVQ